MTTTPSPSLSPIKAQAEIHHAYLLGLQLMISTRKGPDVMEDWMFRLFRRQHLDKFLSSFDKLGLRNEPDAVACAKYHVLSNSIGGVPVEYMEENSKKAWVRFRYPRWMYHGATICGVPIGVSRGFLRGWYAHNGVSLKNPRLGYVCVSEDMTGEFGFCGYFKEYDHDLTDEERLQFAKGELPPPFDPAAQPAPPAQEWNEVRLEKANRNYAMDYIRNGLAELAAVIGAEETRTLGGLAARLIGLQYYPETAKIVEATDGTPEDAARYLMSMMEGMGDEVRPLPGQNDNQASFEHTGLRVLRGLSGQDRHILLACWKELWLGTIRSHRQMMTLDMEQVNDEKLVWTVRRLTA
ncbi:hypothetical protein [Sneathiella chinensis]|uniref:Uncharacterized protein n=1 Tax=Sneathiella chinensis TaxID=349750 RepID=A0ABQ5U604_9PROT|nr:hypothetical protein [Sneathiella chinensis]GLQ07592.1 hypothetical protein GCM10007924_28130 [Sneathiella chinensis]